MYDSEIVITVNAFPETTFNRSRPIERRRSGYVRGEGKE